MERDVELLDGIVIAIQEVHGASRGSNEAPPTNPDPAKPMSNKFRGAQAVILPRLSETEVTVQTTVSGMTLLHPHDKTHTTRRISLASGVADIRP